MNGVVAVQAFVAIAELVSARAGIAIGPSVLDHIERAARRTAQKLGLDDIDGLAERLASDPASFDELIDEVAVGETYFFRDPSHFDFVRSTVLPAFLVSGEPKLRVWSAGCASGEEAYSLAMLLADVGLLERACLLATDISPRALRAARTGRYRDWSLRGAGRSALAHLCDERDVFTVSARIRAAVQFAALNLADASYPSPVSDTLGMHLIFCRNVLMYFHPTAIAGAERRLFAALAPGGYLLLGPSDPILGNHVPFEVLITPNGGLCYRRPMNGALAPRFELARAPVSEPAPAPAFEPLPACEPAPSSVAGPRGLDAIVAAVSAASERADYARVIELATGAPESASLCALHVRALWNLVGASAAEALCTSALLRHELVAELHYLHALVLLELGRDRDAAAALRRTLYLDRSLTIAYFTLGSVCARRGELDAARVAYRNAEARCNLLAIDEPIALGDGIRAGGLGLAAARARAALGAG